MNLTTFLIDIPKVQILLVRQITKRRLIQPPFSTLAALNTIPSTILQRQSRPEDQHQGNFDEVRHDHGPDTQRVARRLVTLVEKWACNVSGADT